METEPHQYQPSNTDLELVNMSSSPHYPIVEEASPTGILVPVSVEEVKSGTHEKNATNADEIQEENEVMTPLTIATSTSGRSNDSISPTPVLWKNRRRPGSSSDGNKVTMTGTVFQGSGGGTPVEILVSELPGRETISKVKTLKVLTKLKKGGFEVAITVMDEYEKAGKVEVELSERELQRLTSRESHKHKREPCQCGLIQGPHIVILSMVCIPVSFIISLCLVFYNGSITWYNLFIYFSEEKSFIHRVTLCPLLVLSFPITVGLSTLLLAVVAAFIQISWSWVRWKTEILDGEKGFYGWLCNKMKLPDCSPYQVVILEDNMAF